MSSTRHDTRASRSAMARPARGTVLAAVGAVGLVSVAALAAAAPAQANGVGHGKPAGHLGAHVFRGPLSDLQPTTSDPLDGAQAKVVFVEHRGSSMFVLVVSGVGTGGVGHTYGAHLHTGACVAGNGAAAGPHYNQSTVNGVVPPVVERPDRGLARRHGGR